MAARKKNKVVESPRLRRVTITRTNDNTWDVVRERDTNGETIGCSSLEDAFDAVRCLYDQDGNIKPTATSGTGEKT